MASADDLARAKQNILRLQRLLAEASPEKDYNDQDADFVRKMIGHHEMAIEMADEEVSGGSNQEVIDLAKSIKKSQQAEINQMKKWLSDRDLDEEGGM